MGSDKKELYFVNNQDTSFQHRRTEGSTCGLQNHSKGQHRTSTSDCKTARNPAYIQKQQVKYGWEGKPKGMEQILWEHGWFDGSRQKDYTKDGKKDSKDVLKKDTSLFLLLSNCVDFEGEQSLLQSKGWEMGALVDCTPKCHCKLAGEGIKYSWGCAKNHYQ